MKTYEELMEVMSMKDMNQITGGTEAQRKIAQDRQRKREAKAKGFDPDKEVLADKPKQKEKLDPTREAIKRNKPKVDRVDSLNVDVNKLPTVDQMAKKRGVKKPTPLTKATASKDYAKNAAKELESPKPSSSSAIVKAEPKAVEKRKPDLRKSQIGKWSQGIKNSPGKLAKRPETKPAEQEVKKVDVKVDEPTTKRRDDMEGKAGQQPGTSRGQGVIDNMKKKKKKGNNLLGKVAGGAKRGAAATARGALKAAKKLGSLAKQSQGSGYGTSTSGDLEGLSGRDKGLIS